LVEGAEDSSDEAKQDLDAKYLNDLSIGAPLKATQFELS
jgi:hypothetical protein